MKTPDKIYLCADAPKMYDWSRVPFEKGGNIEYICKGALLEWAKEQRKDCERVIREHPEDASLWCERDKYEELIDKINSL